MPVPTSELVKQIIDLEDRAVSAESAYGRLSTAAVEALADRGVPGDMAAEELNFRISAAACGCGACLACRSADRGIAGRRPVEATRSSYSGLTRAQRSALAALEDAPDGTVAADGLSVTIGDQRFHTRTIEGLCAAGWASRTIDGPRIRYRLRLRGVGECPTCGAPPGVPCSWPEPDHPPDKGEAKPDDRRLPPPERPKAIETHNARKASR